MKQIKIILFGLAGVILIYFGAKAIRSFSVVNEFTEIKTDHFNITYYGIYQQEADRVAEGLEGSYERIRKDLNDPEHGPIKVVIHPTQVAFNKATGLTNSTATGTSRGPLEFQFIWTNWFNSIFPNDPIKTAIHEFSHCVQLNILIKKEQQELDDRQNLDFDQIFEEKFANNYPQWFWESISIYEANEVNTWSVKYTLRQKPTLKYIANSSQIYNVGYTIIEYIVEKWGKKKLPALITTYVDLEGTLNVSEAEFEEGWIDFVNERY